jgi:hypothetical protein
MNDQAKAMLSMLGYEDMSMDFALKFNTKNTDEGYSFTLEELSLDAPSAGRLYFGLNMIGEIAQSGYRKGSPDMNTVKLRTAKFTFADDSLFDRMIKMQAQTMGVTEDQIKQQMKTALDQSLTQHRYLAAYQAELKDFIDNSGEIEVIAVPQEPVLLGQLMGPVMMQNSKALFEMLNISISAK